MELENVKKDIVSVKQSLESKSKKCCSLINQIISMETSDYAQINMIRDCIKEFDSSIYRNGGVNLLN